jgi:predicted O-linked N-acetylglucosamine transferase (SPINDLY family)
MAQHLSRFRLADLFIDTSPYNAHTTACDSLWAGVPVLTCAGESFASRVAASLLTTMGLPELITYTLDDYEALALELATHPHKLTAIRQKHSDNRLTTPLFDTKRLARDIEKLFSAMHERHLDGLTPAHLQI